MLAPANSAPTSRLSRRASASFGGTSPAAIARASPSTTAVLPTPASPVSSGLFWRRRNRTSIIVRISSSRPTTGSICPARARAVRSRQNCSSGEPPPFCCIALDASPGMAAPKSLSSYGVSFASGEPSIQAGNIASSSSTRIRPNADEIDSSTRLSSGVFSNAASSHAPRIRRSPKSSVASTHARSIAVSMWCEKSLIELAPAGSSPSARTMSRSSSPRSMSQWRAIRCISPSAA
ncbi:Uncharacterised protein [Burkholderia pseudomallei]|nr:Uncharacterised protein [Burkholderia pseudomallei]